MIKRYCKTCGAIFFTKPSIIKNDDGKYCSKKCYHKSCIGRKYSKRTIERMKKAKKGSGNSNWKGGKKFDNGYLLIYKPGHPFARRNYVYEHRIVIEKKIERYLKPQEVVHHINGDTLDNRIENLKLFPNLSKHLKFHRKLHHLSSQVKIA